MSRELWDIIDILKTIALLQFRFFQLKERPNMEFYDELEACFNMLLEKRLEHPYLFDRKALPSAIVIVTSDEGFLGELNTLLVNVGLDCRASAADELVVLGERGARYLEDMKEKFMAFPGVSEEASYKEAEGVRDYLIKGYRRRFGRIKVVYPKFISMTTQRVTALQLLPFQRKEIASSPLTSSMSRAPRNDGAGARNDGAGARNDAPHPSLRGASPEGANDEAISDRRSRLIEETLIEPSEDAVLSGLVETWLKFMFMEIFWSSKQSEFAARIMHLEGSTHELRTLRQKLSFEYFRQIHITRDKAIREISASRAIAKDMYVEGEELLVLVDRSWTQEKR